MREILHIFVTGREASQAAIAVSLATFVTTPCNFGNLVSSREKPPETGKKSFTMLKKAKSAQDNPLAEKHTRIVWVLFPLQKWHMEIIDKRLKNLTANRNY